MKSDFDLLIVGGGMVGACFAALAAGQSVMAELRIALLDAHPPTMPPSEMDVDLRVSAVSRASQRILESVGAWSKIPQRHRSEYTEMRVWDASGQPYGAGSLQFSASATSEPCLGNIIENRRLQWALYEAPALRQRVTVLRAELSGLELTGEQAIATLADGRRITAALVIGADGAASVSRRLAGIDTHGWSYEQHAFVTHVSTTRPHRRTAWQRFLPTGPIAFLPLADGRSSIVWSTTPEHAQQLVDAAPERLAAELEAALGTLDGKEGDGGSGAQRAESVLGRISVAGPRAHFPLKLTHARAYAKPRFVLVGDAAHAVHPLAGQGVNLGLLDCAALTQVLAQALAAGGNVESLSELRVLRRYERWRKSENTLALGLIDGLQRLFSNADPLLTAVRRFGLAGVDRSGLAKRWLIGRAMGTAGDSPEIVRRLD